MKIIGVTGGTGAGKSYVCRELEALGAEIIDCDKIARQVVAKGRPALNEIVKAFGTEILTVDGELDRKKMAAIVFSDKEKLGALNSITHKHIFAEMKNLIAKSTAENVVLDVPLLFQCDFPIECDITVAVVAPEDVRIRRIMERDGIGREAAEARLSNQLSNEQYAELADICFVNNGSFEEIRSFAKALCKKFY